MFNIDGYDIEVTRGDTAALLFHFNGREIPSGTDAVFTIKKRPKDEECVVQKRVDASDGTATIYLTSDDTNHAARTYFWDIRLQLPREDGGYEIQTPMEYAAFTILDVVGGDIGSSDSENVNPDLPVLQIVLEETKEVLARADVVVSSLEALSVEATEADEPSANVVKNEDGSLSIAFGIPRGPQGPQGVQGPKGDSGGGVSFVTDDTLKLQNGVLGVNTAKVVEQDNNLPVTSAAVYTEVGNINALLETI